MPSSCSCVVRPPVGRWSRPLTSTGWPRCAAGSTGWRWPSSSPRPGSRRWGSTGWRPGSATGSTCWPVGRASTAGTARCARPWTGATPCWASPSGHCCAASPSSPGPSRRPRPWRCWGAGTRSRPTRCPPCWRGWPTRACWSRPRPRSARATPCSRPSGSTAPPCSTDAGETDAARARHLHWCLAAAERLGEPGPSGPDGDTWRAGFDEVSLEVRRCLPWARHVPDEQATAYRLSLLTAGLSLLRAGPARRNAASSWPPSSHLTTRPPRSRCGRRRGRPTGASSGTSRSACGRWPPTQHCGPVTAPGPPWTSPVPRSWSGGARASWRFLRRPARPSGCCPGHARWPTACRPSRAGS